MKIMRVVGVALGITLFAISVVSANGARVSGPTTYRITIQKPSDYRDTPCIPVCEGRKPMLEYLEDGLALVLDVPLALLSPITCPIISPLMDRTEQRVYPSYSPASPPR